MDIYKIEKGPLEGRYLLAAWDERGQQFKTDHVRDVFRDLTYVYTFARTIEKLAWYAITYATIEEARAARTRLEAEGWHFWDPDQVKQWAEEENETNA